MPTRSSPAQARDFGRLSGTIDLKGLRQFERTATGGGAAARGRNWLVKYNPVRFAFLCEALQVGAIEKPLSGLQILDIGCGTGIFCELLARAGACVTGVDPATRALEIAAENARAKGLRIDYRAGTVDAAPEQFDVVSAMEVIEHVPDPRVFLRDCAARVKPGGLLVLSTINRSVKSLFYAKIVGEYVLGLLPRGSHQWNRFVQPPEIEAELGKLNFGQFVQSGVAMNLRTGELQLALDRSVNYLLAARAMPRLGLSG